MLRTVFPVQVLEKTYDDVFALNATLKDVLRELAEESPGTVRSNAGGWHSEDSTNILAAPAPALVDLNRKLQRTSIEYFRGRLKRLPPGREYVTILTGWCIINVDGDYNTVHTHPNAHGAGVYYVDVGRPTRRVTNNGFLEFVDPHPAEQMVYCPGIDYRRVLVKPQPGKVVMFPPWLQHWVHPYRGKGERICVGFNMLVSTRPTQQAEA